MHRLLPDSFFENFPVPCAIIVRESGEHIIQKVNKALSFFTAKQSNELEGKPLSLLVNSYRKKIGDDAALFLEQSLQRLFQSNDGRASPSDDTRITGTDGQEWHLQNTVVPGDDQQIAYIIHQLLAEPVPAPDQTTSKEDRENLLRQSEHKYHAAFNYCSVPMWIFDTKTYRFIDVNQAAIKHYGYSREEFMSMTIKDIRPETDVPMVTREVERLSTQGQLFSSSNARHLKKNGEIILVRIESNVIDIDGCKARVVSAFDFTEDERLRKEIIVSNNRLSTAQAMANLGHWVYDLQSKELHWSDEMFRIFDTDREHFKPTLEQLKELVFKEDWPQVSLEQLMIASDNSSFESRVITPQKKQKYLYHTLRLIRDEQLQPSNIEGICMDITQRKLDEAALKRKNDLLDAINKFTTFLMSKGCLTDRLKPAFKVIGETVDVDRIYFYETYSFENGVSLVNQRIEWNAGVENPVIDNPHKQQLSLLVADVAAGLLPGGRFAAIVRELPESTLKSFFQEQETLSVAALPIFVDGKFYGFIGFENLHRERVWQEDEFTFLEAVTGHLATALERNKTIRALRNSQDQFKSVINNLPGITYRCKFDAAFTMLFISDEIARMTGYHPEDFINNNVLSFASIIHPEDNAGDHKIDRHLDNREPFEVEYRLVKRDGGIIWVQDIGRGVYDDNGDLLWIDGVILDITAHKEQEQKLLESNERFRLVMKASGEAIIDWDIQNDVTVWGDSFQEIFGYDLSVYNNNLWSANIHPEDKMWVLRAIDNVLADPSQDTMDISFRFLKANKEVAYVHHRGIFIRNADGVAIRAIGSMSDVSDMMRHTMKIEEQNNVLKEITWIQSHVVRAPAARLQGLMELLKDQVDADSEAAETLQFMEQSAKELDGIITDIIIKSEQVNSKTSDGNLR